MTNESERDRMRKERKETTSDGGAGRGREDGG